MKRSILILSFFLFTTLLIGQNSNSKPLTIGTIEEIQSEILNEKRTLNIYLPTYFDENKKYPVIYVLDGGLDEEFIHIAGLVQFYNLPWVAMVEESIVVGIENVDRRRDFTFPTTVAIDKKASPTSGHSDKFIAYLEKEVQPFIESKFKTTDSKTIIGQSLAGLLAAEVLIKKPTLFDKYIIVSASLWWDNGSLMEYKSEIYKSSFKQATKVYIGVGKEGLAPTEQPHVMEVDANVFADKLKRSKSKNLQVAFDYLPMDDHATTLHQAISNAFRLFYKMK